MPIEEIFGLVNRHRTLFSRSITAERVSAPITILSNQPGKKTRFNHQGTKSICE